MGIAAELPPIKESAFQAQVIELAGLYRWRIYHPWLSVKSDPGWPDLVLCRPPRLLFCEVKSDKGKVTAAQEDWLELLGSCAGVEVHLWRPGDWDEILKTLK